MKQTIFELTRAEEAKIIYEAATYFEKSSSYGKIDEEGRLHLCPMGIRCVLRGYEPQLFPNTSNGSEVDFDQDIFRKEYPGLWHDTLDMFQVGSETDPDVAPGDRDWEEASDEFFIQMYREKGKFLERLKQHWKEEKD